MNINAIGMPLASCAKIPQYNNTENKFVAFGQEKTDSFVPKSICPQKGKLHKAGLVVSFLAALTSLNNCAQLTDGYTPPPSPSPTIGPVIPVNPDPTVPAETLSTRLQGILETLGFKTLQVKSGDIVIPEGFEFQYTDEGANYTNYWTFDSANSNPDKYVFNCRTKNNAKDTYLRDFTSEVTSFQEGIKIKYSYSVNDIGDYLYRVGNTIKDHVVRGDVVGGLLQTLEEEGPNVIKRLPEGCGGCVGHYSGIITNGLLSALSNMLKAVT